MLGRGRQLKDQMIIAQKSREKKMIPLTLKSWKKLLILIFQMLTTSSRMLMIEILKVYAHLDNDNTET